jgi:two-component system phosphate regulon sensor histidine kinase PhoR
VAFRLHSRLIALNAAAMGIILLLLGYFLTISLRTSFEREIEDQLFSAANLAREYIRLHAGQRDSIALAEEISASLQVRVTIVSHDGRVLGDSDLTRESIATAVNRSDGPEIIEALKTGRGVSIRQSTTLNAPLIYVASVLDDGAVLRLATPFSPVENLIGGLRRQLMLAFMASAAATLIFGYMVYAFVSKPLRRMADAAHALATGDLNSELPEVGDRDLAAVGSSLNVMARSLQRKIEELQDDKQRVEAIIAAMSAGVAVFNREPRVVLANQSIRSSLHLNSDPTGKTPLELVRHPAIETAVRDALSGAEVPAVDLVTSDRVLLAKAAPVKSVSGRVELVVVVFHDLTEIRRTEKMRKDFIANVSHEFKTPLTSIRGYAETLLHSTPDDPVLTREFLRAIERNSALLQALVDDLLVLARLESELPIERQALKVRELIEDLVQTRRQALDEKNISVDIECPDVEIMGDRQRLQRALSNLLDNAIHYNRPGGRIQISGKPLAAGFELNVTDTGVGIPQEDLARVFERFYRVEKSRTRDSGGTGLGLSIARHAVESQGGAITVSSKAGSGSTFTVFLPARESRTPAITKTSGEGNKVEP